MFLQPDEILVYIENNESFPETFSNTYIAKLIKTYNNGYSEVELLTDSQGYEKSEKVIILTGNIVSNRKRKVINPKQFYGDLTGRYFVLKKDGNISTTTTNGLGSGIYGNYFSGLDELILCPKAYELQDAAHGDSLSTASLATNRYLDNKILSRGFAEVNDVYNLYVLWNIVLVRSNLALSVEELVYILNKYLDKYFESAKLVDDQTEDLLIELPVNHVLTYFGYDGVIANDIHNNSSSRGCVCYHHFKAEGINGDKGNY